MRYLCGLVLVGFIAVTMTFESQVRAQAASELEGFNLKSDLSFCLNSIPTVYIGGVRGVQFKVCQQSIQSGQLFDCRMLGRRGTDFYREREITEKKILYKTQAGAVLAAEGLFAWMVYEFVRPFLIKKVSERVDNGVSYMTGWRPPHILSLDALLVVAGVKVGQAIDILNPAKIWNEGDRLFGDEKDLFAREQTLCSRGEAWIKRIAALDRALGSIDGTNLFTRKELGLTGPKM